MICQILTEMILTKEKLKDKKSILKSGGKVIAQKKMLESVEQLDGGKEIREALVTASVITKPFTKVAKRTGKTKAYKGRAHKKCKRKEQK